MDKGPQNRHGKRNAKANSKGLKGIHIRFFPLAVQFHNQTEQQVSPEASFSKYQANKNQFLFVISEIWLKKEALQASLKFCKLTSCICMD